MLVRVMSSICPRALRKSCPHRFHRFTEDFSERTIKIFCEWLEDATKERDRSHGMEHYVQVMEQSDRLAREEKLPLTTGELLIVRLAALAHDLCDHKYVKKDSGNDLELRRNMHKILQACGVNELDIHKVILISDNISLSKELRGELQVLALESLSCTRLRNLVSDADKLEAMGYNGIVRLVIHKGDTYKRMHAESPSLLLPHLRREIEKHIIPRISYIHTNAGKRSAVVLCIRTKEIAASDKLLGDLVKAALDL